MADTKLQQDQTQCTWWFAAPPQDDVEPNTCINTTLTLLPWKCKVCCQKGHEPNTFTSDKTVSDVSQQLCKQFEILKGDITSTYRAEWPFNTTGGGKYIGGKGTILSSRLHQRLL